VRCRSSYPRADSTRGKTSKEMADLARGRSTSRPKDPKRLRGPAEHPLAAVSGRRTWEARGAAERGRGQHVSSTRRAEETQVSHAASDGTGDRRAGASRKRLRAGSLLDGGVNGSIGRTRRRTAGSRPHGRSEDLANTRGQVACSRGARGTGSSRPRSSSRRPNPRDCWSRL